MRNRIINLLRTVPLTIKHGLLDVKVRLLKCCIRTLEAQITICDRIIALTEEV